MTLEIAGSPAGAQAPEGPAATTTTTETPSLRYELPEPEQEITTGEGKPTPQTPEDDTEEVDYEGSKYRVPKALKDAFLRQSDYTQKTQAVAAQRKALEPQQAEIAERAKADDAHLDRMATIKLLDHQLGGMPQTPQQWAQLEQQDPARAASLFRQMQQIQGVRADLARQAQQYQQDRAAEQQRETAKAAQDAVRVLKEKIPDFGEQTLRDVEKFAVEAFGVTPEQVRGVVDPMVWLLGYRLMKAEAAVKGQIAAATAKPASEVKPVPQVSKGTGAKSTTDLADSDSDEVWLEKRNAQLAARRRR
ncbi:MAG: hypothetical protein F8N37_12085 [Telmatospirillum sp.]|nr:hypothetical protein [Telmatospirillum sp.]